MILALNPKRVGKRLRPPQQTNCRIVIEGKRCKKRVRLGEKLPPPQRQPRTQLQCLTPRATSRKNNRATRLINIHKRVLQGGGSGVLFFNPPAPDPHPAGRRRNNNRGMFIIYTRRYTRAPLDKYFCILQSGMSGITRVLHLTTEERSARGKK